MHGCGLQERRRRNACWPIRPKERSLKHHDFSYTPDLRMPWYTSHAGMGDTPPCPGAVMRVAYVRACATRITLPGVIVFCRYLFSFACRGIQDAHRDQNDAPDSHTTHHRTHILALTPFCHLTLGASQQLHHRRKQRTRLLRRVQYSYPLRESNSRCQIESLVS